MQKIPRAIGKASGVAIGETNASGTLSVEGGGLSVFAGLVTARSGKPFTVLALNKNNFRNILGKAYHPTEAPYNYEAMRHLNQALNGGNGYVVRVVPSDMEIPYIKISTPGNSNQPVTAAKVDPTLSTFTVMPGNAVGDGKTAIVLTFTAKDQNGKNIANLDHVGFESIGVTVNIDSVNETSNGVYTANLTGVIPGRAVIRPTIANAAVGSLSKQVTIDPIPNQAATLDPSKCRFWVSNSRVYADGVSEITLYVAINDYNGDPISIDQARVGFTGLGSINVNITSTEEDLLNPGTFTAKLSGTQVGNVQVLPTIDGGMIGNIQGLTVYLDKAPTGPGGSNDQIDGIQSDLMSSDSNIYADGSDSVTLTFTARNTNGDLMPGIANKLTLAVFNLTGVTKTPFVETTAGVYTTDLTVARASTGDRGEIHVIYDGAVISDVKFTLVVDRIKPTLPVVDDLASTLTATAGTGYATGGTGTDSIITLTLKLVDQNGLPMANRAVTFQYPGTLSLGRVREPVDGTYEVDVWSYTVGSGMVVPLLDGLAIGALMAPVDFIAAPVYVPVINEPMSAATFSLLPASIPADDATQAHVSIQVIDTHNHAMTGIASMLSIDTGKPGLTISPFVEVNNGFYTATITSATVGTYTLSPIYDGGVMPGVSKTLTVTTFTIKPDGTRTTFKAEPATITDDGSQTSKLTLKLKNSAGKAITGSQYESRIGFDIDNPALVTVSRVVEDANEPGTFVATVTGTSVHGTVTIKPQFDGQFIGTRQAVITLNDPQTVVPPTAIDLSHSTFTASKTQLRTDDATDSILFTFTALDAAGQPITTPLLPHLVFKPSLGTGYTLNGVANMGNGVYEVTLEPNGIHSGDLSIEVVYDTQPITLDDGNGGKKDAEIIVKLVGAVSELTSLLTLTKTAIDADGTTMIVSFTPKDAAQNTIEGAKVEFTYSGVGSAALVKGTQTDVAGVSSVELSSTTPGHVKIGVMVDGVTVPGLENTLTINSIVNAGNSTLTANPTSLVGDGNATSTLTLTLKDANGAAVTVAPANITLKANDGTATTELQPTFTDNGAGVYATSVSQNVTVDTTVTYTAVVWGDELATVKAPVTFTAPVVTKPTANVADSTLADDLNGADGKADGATVYNVTLTLKNGSTDITGASVKFKPTGTPLTTTHISDPIEKSGTLGTYVGTVSASETDTVTLGVEVDGVDFGITPVTLKLVKASTTQPVVTKPSIDNSKTVVTLTPTNGHADADGVATVAVEIQPQDTAGTALKGVTATVKALLGQTTAESTTAQVSAVNVDATTGFITFTVTDTVAEDISLKISLGGTVQATDIDKGIVFDAVVVAPTTPTDPVDADSSITVSNMDAAGKDADGQEHNITVTLKAGTTAITGKTDVTVKATPAVKATTTLTTTALTETPAGSGKYVGTVKATKADDFTLNIQIGGVDFGTKTVAVKFKDVTPGPAPSKTPDATKSTFTVTPATPSTGDDVTFTVELKDNAGAAIENQEAKLTISEAAGGVVSGVTFTEGATKGTYTATLAIDSSQAGKTNTYTLSYDGKALAITPAATITVN
ncbi:TPA: hypothetical protein LU109_003534 [Enterobacter hormaechei subsp. xiangfangensis]|nr:hypothetical protein [Enterobacter hormaechei subsp. xiangfangensis]